MTFRISASFSKIPARTSSTPPPTSTYLAFQCTSAPLEAWLPPFAGSPVACADAVKSVSSRRHTTASSSVFVILAPWPPSATILSSSALSALSAVQLFPSSSAAARSSVGATI